MSETLRRQLIDNAPAIEVEHLADVYGRILAIGGEQRLDDDEMARVLEKFSRYGVQDS